MKTIFLLKRISFGLVLLLGLQQAQAQNKPETPKQPKKEVKKETRIIIVDGDTVKNVTTYKSRPNMPDYDSIAKAMNILGEQMRKKGDEISKSIEKKLSEPQMKKLEKQLEDMGKEMEKLGEELEESLSDLDLNRNEEDVVIEVPEAPEVPETPEIDENNNDDEEMAGADIDTSKNKTITINDDGIHIRTGKRRPKNVVKKPKNSATDFLLLDLGVNTFTNNNSFELPASANPLDLNIPKSVNVTLHIFRTGVNLYHHNLYTTFGLAYDMHDYRFTKSTTLLPEVDSFKYVESPYKLEKNKLSAQYLTLPVMIHFESNPMRPSRSFKLGVGGWGGFLVNSYRKQVSENFGKQHLHDKFNLNDVNYGVRGQIGYGVFTLYSQYALSPLFKANVGAPELNPITFGVILNGFKWN